MASVQELILAATAKQKKSPLSMLADAINAGSAGYSEGIGLRKTMSEANENNAQADLYRRQMAAQIIQAEQERIQNEENMRSELTFKIGAAAEQDLRNRQKGIEGPMQKPTPQGKVEETLSFEDGKSKRTVKLVPFDTPKPMEIPNSVEEALTAEYNAGRMTLQELLDAKQKISGGSFILGGTGADGKPIFYGSKDPTKVVTGEVPGGGILYPKTPSDSQQNASLFGKRAAEANQQLDELLKGGLDPTSVSTGGQTYLPNIAQSAGMQQFEQAKRNFMAAILRKESGALISKDEMIEGGKQYFPQVGDKPEVLKQKEINRQSAIDGINKMAGPMASGATSSTTAPTTPIKIKVIRISDGQSGTINESDFDSTKYRRK